MKTTRAAAVNISKKKYDDDYHFGRREKAKWLRLARIDR
jgi:hypothetical protein